LAAAIGVNTALFSVLNSAVLGTLRVPDPDQLVALRWAGDNDLMANHLGYGNVAPDSDGLEGDATFPYGVFERLRTESRDVAALFAFVSANLPLNLVAGEEGGM